MIVEETPPSNNMGAENISALAPLENRSVIDWLSWTVKETDVHAAIEKCGFNDLDFTAGSGGGMGYKSTMRAGNIVVFHDGAENMGCHFSLTGQGCRQLEAVRKKNNLWYSLLHHLASIGANITRIDLAVDNVDGALDIAKIENAVRTKSVQSRFRKATLYEQMSLTEENADLGKTIYIGSPTSRIKIRFYDKAAQLGIKTHWVRCEIQCMSERAKEAVRHLLKGVEIGALTVGALNNYFRPVNDESVNKSQCTTQTWWAAWLTTTEKIRLSTAQAIKLVTEVMDHIRNQYSASLAMIRKYLGVTRYHEYMADVLDTGKARMKKKHEWIIQSTIEDMAADLPF